jgi:hypothetical protein
LVQAGEWELHLGLDTRGPPDAASRRARREVVEQRRLSDSRLTTKDEGPTMSRKDTRNNLVEDLALAPTTQQ